MDDTETSEAETSAPTLVRLVRKAIRDWTRQLVDVTGRNTLLCFRPLKAGTLDLAGANDGGPPRHPLRGEGPALRRLRRRELPMPSAGPGPSRHGPSRTTRSAGSRPSRWPGAWRRWTNTASSYTPQAPVLLCRAKLEPRGGAADDFDLQLDDVDWEINPVLLHVLAAELRRPDRGRHALGSLG